MSTARNDELLAALAEPSRRRVLDLLVRAGDSSASTLATEVPFTRQAVVKHLAALEDVGLVTRHRDGKEVRFRVNPKRLDQATRAMARLAAEWDRRLVTIKQIAETPRK